MYLRSDGQIISDLFLNSVIFKFFFDEKYFDTSGGVKQNLFEFRKNENNYLYWALLNLSEFSNFDSTQNTYSYVEITLK